MKPNTNVTYRTSGVSETFTQLAADERAPSPEVEAQIRQEFLRFVEECRREIVLREVESSIDQDVLEVAALLKKRKGTKP
jgi:hypothetical protein